MDTVLLAVNGGLMRGMRSHSVMLAAGARFMREDATASEYRMWSIDDEFPAMVRATQSGACIALELWELTPEGFVSVLQREPKGLSVAHVNLLNGDTVLGVVGEPILCEGRREITEFGGWRAYVESLE